MEDKNQNKIFVEIDEEIPSIIEKINNCECKKIILVIPHGALVLRSIINLKILKKRAEEINKVISILKTDEPTGKQNQFNNQERGRMMNSIVRNNRGSLNLKRDIDIDNNKKETISKYDNYRLENQESKHRVFDIVKKINNVEEGIQNSQTIVISNEEDDYPETQNDKFKDLDSNDSRVSRKISVDSKKRKRIIMVPALNSKVLVLFIFLIIITLSIASFFMFQRADVGIVLKNELVSYNFELTADESIENVDVTNNKIPLEIIQIESEESNTYPATGKKHIEEEASGEITIFNEFSSASQGIVASTRFLSKDGKLFRIKEAVNIPGFTRVEGVDVPGQTKVKIYADKPGEEYNIDPSSFTLPALQEIKSPKYQFIYARSTQAMTGGLNEEVSYFSESDYITAKDKLVKLVQEKNNSDLTNKVSEDVIPLGGSEEIGEAVIKTNIEVGDTADDYTMTVSMQSNVATISKNDLDMLVNAMVDEKLEKNKIVLENSRSFDLGDISAIEDGKAKISVNAKQQVAVKINADKIKEEIANKNEKELTTYFNSIEGIKSTDISLKPYWIKKIPSAYDKIYITIDINNSI